MCKHMWNTKGSVWKILPDAKQLGFNLRGLDRLWPVEIWSGSSPSKLVQVPMGCNGFEWCKLSLFELSSASYILTIMVELPK